MTNYSYYCCKCNCNISSHTTDTYEIGDEFTCSFCETKFIVKEFLIRMRIEENPAKPK